MPAQHASRPRSEADKARPPEPTIADVAATLADVMAELRGINVRLDGIDVRLDGIDGTLATHGGAILALAKKDLTEEDPAIQRLEHALRSNHR